MERDAKTKIIIFQRRSKEIKFLLYADGLVLLSPTEHGLQRSLALVEKHCQTWALTVNLAKTKIIIFQRRSRCQGNKYIFTLGNKTIVIITVI